MSHDDDWFEGRSVEQYERCYLRRVILAVMAGIFIAACVVGLQGCATPETFQGVCALKPMGTTENGVGYFLTYCEAK